jgi:hypothetical protein
MGPSTLVISNGLCLIGASLADGLVILMFYPSSQTLSPTECGVKFALFLFVLTISAMVRLLACISFLIWSSSLSCSSIEKLEDVGLTMSRTLGSYPMSTWKGDC